MQLSVAMITGCNDRRTETGSEGCVYSRSPCIALPDGDTDVPLAFVELKHVCARPRECMHEATLSIEFLVGDEPAVGPECQGLVML